MSFVIAFGKWGGFYFHRGWTTRLCLGWVSMTYIPEDTVGEAEDVLNAAIWWHTFFASMTDTPPADGGQDNPTHYTR